MIIQTIQHDNMVFVVLVLSLVSLQLTTVDGVGCPYLSMPPGTNRTSDDTLPHAVVDYSCLIDGTSFPNGESNFRTICLPTGDWSRLPQPCKSVRCGHQHLIHNSIVSTASTLAGEKVTYSCMYGFGFPEGTTKVVTCNETVLEWQPTADDTFENMTCDARYCKELPKNFSTVFYDGLDAYDNGTIAVGSEVTAYCKEGYVKGTSTILSSGKCSATTKLSGIYEECTVRTCSDFPMPSNSKVVFDQKEYQKRTRYHCEEDGRFPGGKSHHVMECDYNGQWKSEPPSTGCQVGGCEEGWVKYDGNCYYISSTSSWGLRYYYAEESCILKKSHLASITSREEGFFIYSKSHAVDRRDYWIGFHFDTSVKEWRWFDGNKETFTKWHKGYPELQESCARVTVNSVWRDRDCDDLLPYICKKPTMCDTPPVILNGAPDIAVIPYTMDVGDSLTYVCDEGYSFRSDDESERTITCMIGSYYSAIENCQRTMCPPLNRIGYYVRNAVIEGTQASTYLSSVTWRCNTGFIFPDGTFTQVMTCQGNRSWSQIPDMCIKAHCPVPGVLNASPMNGSGEVGFADIYTCEEGYEFSTGESERLMICQHDGTWSPDDSCWKKACQPYVQYNANVSSSEIARYKDKVRITCDKGYQFPDGTDSKQTTCSADHHWKPYLPLCEPKTCPGGVAPTVPHATSNTTLGIINTVILYICDSGYKFIDGDTERVAYCDLDTLSWIGVPHECLSEDPLVSDNTVGVHTIVSTIIAALSITTLIIFMCLIVCSDCNSDRQLIKVCNNCESDDVDEEESDSGSEYSGPEPERLEMV